MDLDDTEEQGAARQRKERASPAQVPPTIGTACQAITTPTITITHDTAIIAADVDAVKVLATGNGFKISCVT